MDRQRGNLGFSAHPAVVGCKLQAESNVFNDDCATVLKAH